MDQSSRSPRCLITPPTYRPYMTDRFGNKYTSIKAAAGLPLRSKLPAVAGWLMSAIDLRKITRRTQPKAGETSVKATGMLMDCEDPSATLGFSGWQTTHKPNGEEEDGGDEGYAKLQEFSKIPQGSVLVFTQGVSLGKADPRYSPDGKPVILQLDVASFDVTIVPPSSLSVSMPTLKFTPLAELPTTPVGCVIGAQRVLILALGPVEQWTKNESTGNVCHATVYDGSNTASATLYGPIITAVQHLFNDNPSGFVTFTHMRAANKYTVTSQSSTTAHRAPSLDGDVALVANKPTSPLYTLDAVYEMVNHGGISLHFNDVLVQVVACYIGVEFTTPCKHDGAIEYLDEDSAFASMWECHACKIVFSKHQLDFRFAITLTVEGQQTVLNTSRISDAAVPQLCNISAADFYSLTDAAKVAHNASALGSKLMSIYVSAPTSSYPASIAIKSIAAAPTDAIVADADSKRQKTTKGFVKLNLHLD